MWHVYLMSCFHRYTCSWHLGLLEQNDHTYNVGEVSHDKCRCGCAIGSLNTRNKTITCLYVINFQTFFLAHTRLAPLPPRGKLLQSVYVHIGDVFRDKCNCENKMKRKEKGKKKKRKKERKKWRKTSTKKYRTNSKKKENRNGKGTKQKIKIKGDKQSRNKKKNIQEERDKRKKKWKEKERKQNQEIKRKRKRAENPTQWKNYDGRQTHRSLRPHVRALNLCRVGRHIEKCVKYVWYKSMREYKLPT